MASLKEAVELSLASYAVGVSDYIDVLDAEQQLFPAENNLAQTQLNQLLVVVNLYKALGGGWDVPSSDQEEGAGCRLSLPVFALVISDGGFALAFALEQMHRDLEDLAGRVRERTSAD